MEPTEDEIAADLPFASTEQALVIFDEDAKVEHLVLELRFDKANAAFGYLIPVAGKPTVDKIAHPPWDGLRDIYGFSVPLESNLGLGLGTLFGPMQGAGGALGARGGGEAPPPVVEVLEELPIGSFEAFTLVVHDARELGAWMKEHGFVAPKAIDAWADRYVDFQIVALKYAAKDGGAGMTSETLRISFPTPLPFFPYSEVAAPKLSKRARSKDIEPMPKKTTRKSTTKRATTAKKAGTKRGRPRKTESKPLVAKKKTTKRKTKRAPKRG